MKNIFKNLIAVLFSTLFTTAVCAQSYPIKTIKIVVPFPPGGATDIIARAVAEKLQLAFNKPVIVENKAGASGNIGVGDVVRSAPDGYTLVMGAAQTLTINHQLFSNLTFVPQKDLAPIIVVASVPNVLVVANRLPAKTFKSLSRWLKQTQASLVVDRQVLVVLLILLSRCSSRLQEQISCTYLIRVVLQRSKILEGGRLS